MPDQRRRSESEEVYRQIKKPLIEYRVRPGQQLMIGELAECLGVSHTPVREALIRLRSEFLLDPTPRRGFFAKSLDIKEMTEVTRLTYLVLGHCVKNEVLQIEAHIVEKMRAELNTESPAYAAYDHSRNAQAAKYARRFARLRQNIVSLAGDKVMLDVVCNADDRSYYLHTLGLEAPKQLNDSLATANQLLTALATREANHAVALLDRELAATFAKIPSLVKEGLFRTASSPLCPPSEGPSGDSHATDAHEFGVMKWKRLIPLQRPAQSGCEAA